jgi:peptidoglycan/LPS O-acetylase OafA/YrhL
MMQGHVATARSPTPDSATLPDKPGYIDSLTPLRGVAALWVVVFHYNQFLGFLKLGSLVDKADTLLVNRGYLLVDFFFILSGFIITHVYADKLRAGASGSTWRYLWARFSRLYPLHLSCMLLLLALAGFIGHYYPGYYARDWAESFPFEEFFAYLGFAVSFNLTKGFTWNVPAWSICAEWWAYVAALVLIPLLHRGSRGRTLFAWAAALAGLLGLQQLTGKDNLDFTMDFGLARCVLEFTIGIGVYQFYLLWAGSGSRLGTDWAFGAVACATLLVLHFPTSDLLVPPLFAMLILCAALNAGKTRRILDTRVFRFLGDISYSIYLLQIFWVYCWLAWIDLHWRPDHAGMSPAYSELLLWLAVIVVGVLCTAALAYRWVEIPGRKLLRNWVAR